MATQKSIYTATNSQPVLNGYSITEYTISSNSSDLDRLIADITNSQTIQNYDQDTAIKGDTLFDRDGIGIRENSSINITNSESIDGNRIAMILSNAEKTSTLESTRTERTNKYVGGKVTEALSSIEQAILRANNPIEVNETEVITVNGQTGLWANKAEVVNWSGVIPINQYIINEDAQPEVVKKQTNQLLEYEQHMAVRYLRPPTPPSSEIIIKQEKNVLTPPAPPLVIRQQPPRPETPAPLVIRGEPPQPPAFVAQKIITIPGKKLPPAPRKVVFERLPVLPSKPQPVIIERWLPHKEVKRKVILKRPTGPDPVIPRPRNVIVQWETPQIQIKNHIKDLGVIRANPVEYVQTYGASLKTHDELPEFVRQIRPPTGVVLAAEWNAPSLVELEGDLQALTLIDLDREGLGEYKKYLSRFLSGGSVTKSKSRSALVVV